MELLLPEFPLMERLSLRNELPRPFMACRDRCLRDAWRLVGGTGGEKEGEGAFH